MPMFGSRRRPRMQDGFTLHREEKERREASSERPLRILLINWMDMANPMAGGAEVHLTEIFRRFAGRGDEIILASSGFRGGERFDEYHGIDIIRRGNRETFNFVVPRLVKSLDVIHNFDVIVEDINKIPFFTPLYSHKPLLVIVPHLFGDAVFRETNPLVASYVYLMEHPIPRVYRHAQFEAISESTARDLARRGIDPGRIHTVYCGMDHARYTADPAVPDFERPTVLYLGRVKRYKSVDVLVKAFPAVVETVPDARLVIAGSGDDLPRLRALAASAGIEERVEFPGFVTEDGKVNLMRRSHVIVNPSPREGWGLTNVEAGACGTPAVASDADGLRDSVVDGETGFLFPYGDNAALADRLIRILTDDTLRTRLGEAARARALTFTWDTAARETMTIVDSLARRP